MERRDLDILSIIWVDDYYVSYYRQSDNITSPSLLFSNPIYLTSPSPLLKYILFSLGWLK